MMTKTNRAIIERSLRRHIGDIEINSTNRLRLKLYVYLDNVNDKLGSSGNSTWNGAWQIHINIKIAGVTYASRGTAVVLLGSKETTT